MLSKNDITILRELAGRYQECAQSPVHVEKRALWLKLNTLNMERPMLLIDQIPWNEMDVDGTLVCRVQDPYWRNVEESLRQQIYKFTHMPADMVLNPYISLPRPIHNSGWGIDTQVSRRIILENGATSSSSEYINQFESIEDVEKIQMPKLTLDVQREKQIREEADVIFDGIIPYRMQGLCMHLGLWDVIAQWMGVENCYFALMDDPDMIHAMMEKMTQGVLGMIEQMNTQQLFDVDSNLCHCSHTFLPDLPKADMPAVSENAWSFGLAQLFTAVSPAITDEFEVAYMQRIFPHYGAIYYGCCDRLDDRMDVIRKLPNVRKLSCSPWSDREHFAQVMPDTTVMSNKPNPAFLAGGTLDEAQVRSDLRRTIEAARKYNRSLELILKDISTVNHNPQCLWRWQEIAMEEMCR